MSTTNRYLPFDKAREYVRDQNLQSTQEWKKWSKGTLEGKKRRPDFIPSSPDVVYKECGWINWTDWRKKQQETEYMCFEEAREFIRSLNLRNSGEWQRYYQGKMDGLTKPVNIPWNPEAVYEEHWNGIKDWLGTNWRDYKSAREFVRSLHLDGQIGWKMYCKGELSGYDPRPVDIPSVPSTIYADCGWIDMADWLDTQHKRRRLGGDIEETWFSYDKARDFVHSLKLASYDEWLAYIDDRIEDLPPRPSKLPKSPSSVYKDFGWEGWKEWIGYDETFSSEKPNHVIIYKEVEVQQRSEDFLKLDFNILKIKYENNSTMSKLLTLVEDTTITKSIIELDLESNEVDEIVEYLFHFNTDPLEMSGEEKAFFGLIFLTYISNRLQSKLSYSSLWKAIFSDIEESSKINSNLLDRYFDVKHYPTLYLKEAIKYACKLFNLRNNFDCEDEHHYFRNTVLLQVGILNDGLEHLKLWLSHYNQPITISELLDLDSSNYSKQFSEGWRVIRRYRDNILSKEQATSILKNNKWFKYSDFNKLLEAAKQKHKKQLITTEENFDLSVFYLEKIYYGNDGLSFTINVQDLYTLYLDGYKYEIYIDNNYKGLLLANNQKELVLDSEITFYNPDVNKVDLEVRNEDGDIVYASEITLFDFNEQVVLFDEDGNIHHNIFKKLNTSKKYHILVDSDLDCSFQEDAQREYFDGYATLIPFIGYQNECKITYNDELLFELNFHAYVEKPSFIDQLVLYTQTNESFIIGNEYDFELKVMYVDESTDDVSLLEIPDEAKIVKWSYSDGFVDDEDISIHKTMITSLYSEMITAPKHTLLIKYKKRVFKKVLYCNFYEKHRLFRLFQNNKNGDSKLIEQGKQLNRADLKNYKYFLSSFGNNELYYLKNKSNFYQQIQPNKTFNFAQFTGFGEDIFFSKHLFNAHSIGMFKYVNSDEYISIKSTSTSCVVLKNELPYGSKIVALDKNGNYHEYEAQSINPSDKNIDFKEDLVSVIVVQGTLIIDSSNNIHVLKYLIDKFNFKNLQHLLVANFPFLATDLSTKFLRQQIINNFEEFFKVFYNDKITLNNSIYLLDFYQFKTLFDHLLLNVSFDPERSKKVLQELILYRKDTLLLETPIILFKLILSSNSKKMAAYFLNMLDNVKLKDERDDDFIKRMIDDLFNTVEIRGFQKHDFKVAMHYINGKYYLKQALEKFLNV